MLGGGTGCADGGVGNRGEGMIRVDWGRVGLEVGGVARLGSRT